MQLFSVIGEFLFSFTFAVTRSFMVTEVNLRWYEITRRQRIDVWNGFCQKVSMCTDAMKNRNWKDVLSLHIRQVLDGKYDRKMSKIAEVSTRLLPFYANKHRLLILCEIDASTTSRHAPIDDKNIQFCYERFLRNQNDLLDGTFDKNTFMLSK